jgi:DNA-directed RNA polymerase specialized sigma24 family protein
LGVLRARRSWLRAEFLQHNGSLRCLRSERSRRSRGERPEQHPGLRRFAAIVAPVEIEPEDLVQEALYRLLRSGPLARIDHPTAYLRRAITNLASNERRALGRRRAAVIRLNFGDRAPEIYPSDLQDLMTISPRSRAAVYLRTVEGRDYDEIADLLGCRVSTARSITSRGLRRLRTFLSEEVHDATA